MDSHDGEPRNDLERAISAIWQDVLGVRRVGVDDNFFDLGGHSLLAVEVAARIRALLPVNFLVADIQRQQTVAAQASAIAHALAAHADERVLRDVFAQSDDASG